MKLKYLLTACAILSLSACELVPPPHYASTDAIIAAPPALPAPPAKGSKTDKADLAAVLHAQETRTADESAFAKADALISVYRFADVLGPNFNPANLPVATRFFWHVQEDEHDIIEVIKKQYDRPRPYIADTRVQPIVKKPNNTSYPSGHTAYGYVMASLLSEMIPEKKKELEHRAALYGRNRIIGGAHYPKDVEAGKIAGRAIAARLIKDQQFRHDFALAKAELRQKLGY